MKTFFLPTPDGLMLSVAIFLKDNPKAILQIIHGSAEHKERYFEFAQFMNDNGFAVIISDNRGHGLSVDAQYPLGFIDSYQKIIDDQYLITQYFRALYPEKEFMLLGHSLGTVFARIYLEKHDAIINKLVLSGTVSYNRFTPIGITLAEIYNHLEGETKHSLLLRTLIMNGNDTDWLSKNRENIERFKSDPLCGFAYPNESVLTILRAVHELNELKHYECHNPNLPILCVSGEEDPVTGGSSGLNESFKRLHEIGYTTISNKVYPNMRHEVLNEANRYEVFQDILNFYLDK